MPPNPELNHRLTDRAKKILRFADEEAQRLKAAVVRGEHMLLGLLKEGSGVASKVLRNLDVDLESLKKAVSERINQKQDIDKDVDGHVRKADEASELLKAADAEARELEHDFVGTEDILLGILRNTQSVAGEVLEKFGVQLESAREEVRKVLTAPPGGATSSESTAQTDDGQIDISEKGRDENGRVTSLDRRLFMQFTAFSGSSTDLVAACQEQKLQAVVYSDINDSNGVGLMAFCENPDYIVEHVHPVINGIANLNQKHAFTMFGRTYSIGYENNLEEVLVNQPIKRVCNQETPWAVYYPLRRSGQFERESKNTQRKMLMEHGGIGHAFGKAGLATDIRLAAHGLNSSDNDFVIGLLGKELFPLSAVVQRMRRTRQTSEFIETMGPFFVGRATWQPSLDGSEIK